MLTIRFPSIYVMLAVAGEAFLTAPASATPTDQRIAQIAEQTFQQRALRGFTGSVLVDHDGRVVFRKSYGGLQSGSARKMTSKTIFDIGSITKLLTKIAVLRLAQDGRLNLTDTVSRFFPLVPADKSSITVAQLIAHQSGFPDHHAHDRDVLTRDEALRLIFARKLDFRPGEKQAYSNTGYTVLAAIVEQTSGTSFPSYVAQLLRSAGLRHTADFSDQRFDRLPVAYTYLNGEPQGSPASWPGPTWSTMGNGEFLSTTSDLRNLLKALKDHKILNAQHASKVFGVGQPSQLGREIFWAGGGAGGNSSLTYYPDRGLMVVVLSNRMGWIDQPGKELKLLLPAEEARDELEGRLHAVLPG